MKIFLSYASEDSAIADDVAQTLKAHNHKLFYAPDRNLPGLAYDNKIASDIRQSDLFIFLISPASVRSGKYTITELKVAEQKWPNPSGRILPVMISPTPMEDIPAYLRAVSVLEPKGNLPAEVALAIEKRFPWRMLGIVVLAVLALASYFLWYRSNTLVLSPPSLSQGEYDPFVQAEVFDLSFDVSNQSGTTYYLEDVLLETDPPEGANIRGDQSDRLSAMNIIIDPHAEQHVTQKVIQNPSGPTPEQYRICLKTLMEKSFCSTFSDWPEAREVENEAFSLEAQLYRNVSLVESIPQGFLMTDAVNKKLLAFSATSQELANLPLLGEPTVLYTDADSIWVGTSGPNTLSEYDPETLALRRQFPIERSSALVSQFGDPVSTTPASIGRSGNSLFVVTRGTQSEAGLIMIDLATLEVSVPDYYQDIAFDLTGINLVSDGRQVWGVQIDTTPSSIYQFTPDTFEDFSGHNYDVVGSATDLVLKDGNSTLVHENKLTTLTYSGGSLNPSATLTTLPVMMETANDWLDVQLESVGDNTIVFRNKRQTIPVTERLLADVFWVSGTTNKKLDSFSQVEIMDLASNGEVYLAVLEHDQMGRRLIVRPVQDTNEGASENP